jgi:hypothetical protein
MAALTQLNAEWAAALLENEDADAAHQRTPAAWPSASLMAAVLPGPRRLTWAVSKLNRSGPDHDIAAALDGGIEPWAPDVAGAVMNHLAAAARQGQRVHEAMWLLPAVNRKLPATGPLDYAAGLRTLAESVTTNEYLADELRRSADIVSRRRYFLRELQ